MICKCGPQFDHKTEKECMAAMSNSLRARIEHPLEQYKLDGEEFEDKQE